MAWSEVKTRQLLRKLHVPAGLEDDPTAFALAAAIGIRSPRRAVQITVQNALQPYPSVYSTMVHRVDVENENIDAVTRDLGCSERSVYRYRADAMKAITSEIERTLQGGATGASCRDDGASGLLSLANYLTSRRTHASLQRALGYYRRIAEDAPGCASAYAGIADVLFTTADAFLCSPATALQQCADAVERGLTVAGCDADLHAMSALLSLVWRRDNKAATVAIKNALSHDKGSTRVCLASGRIALARGDYAAAIEHVQRGIRAGGNGSELNTLLGRIYARKGSTGAGIRELEAVIAGDASFSHARFELARIYAGQHQFDESAAHLSYLMAEEPRVSYAALQAYVTARGGDNRAAMEVLDDSSMTLLVGHAGHYLRAYAHMGIGDKTRTLEHLRSAVRLREPWAAFMHQDEVFMDLWGLASFRRLRAA